MLSLLIRQEGVYTDFAFSLSLSISPCKSFLNSKKQKEINA